MNRVYLFVAAAVLGGLGFWKFFTRPGEVEPATLPPMPEPNTPPFPYVTIEPGKYLTATAGNAFLAMKAAAAQAGVSLPVNTAWRSREYQQRLYDAYKAGQGPMAARPGTSLHEKGIAVDLANVNPATSGFNPRRRAWLDANAARYGFYNTGAHFSSKEPWHWVYGVQREGVAVTT